MKPPKELFLIWNSDDQYYDHFFSLEEAARFSESENRDIFKADIKLLGQFEVVTTVVKKAKGKK